EKYGVKDITTVTVDTGGFSGEECARIAARSKELGADRHVLIDGSEQLYADVLKYLIFGNVSRDGYPLCVSAERLVQAREVVKVADQLGVTHIVHGSTGAGNDQYRFDTVILVEGQHPRACENRRIEPVAPIREHGISRDASRAFLTERGFAVSASTTYSYNVGLWGVSVGGKETLTSHGLLPDTAWYSKVAADATRTQITLEFVRGEPVSLKQGAHTVTGPVAVIKALADLGNRLGIGRHYHVGTSVPGKKGRVAYESPAADILYEAHRTLEKITLSQGQIFTKKTLAEEFGRLVHEARFLDPLMNDIKAFLSSSQTRVTGTVEVELDVERIRSAAARSPYDLLGVAGSQYGEVASAYSGRDAAGAARLHAYEQQIYHAYKD
ncbi:MAG TPA: argininosuccinate synthase, partial [Alphaproteobacteria bacterium]|nr:argininosuccinate synthase [Alphaproteobacteria bacterium]